MSRGPRVRLHDILTSIDQIGRYTTGVTLDEFRANSLLQDAVIRRLEIIGEAVKGLDPDHRTRHPSIPWRAIAGTRDKLIHDYYLVDEFLIWEMVQEHLAPLRSAVVALLAAAEDGEE